MLYACGLQKKKKKKKKLSPPNVETGATLDCHPSGHPCNQQKKTFEFILILTCYRLKADASHIGKTTANQILQTLPLWAWRPFANSTTRSLKTIYKLCNNELEDHLQTLQHWAWRPFVNSATLSLKTICKLCSTQSEDHLHFTKCSLSLVPSYFLSNIVAKVAP